MKKFCLMCCLMGFMFADAQSPLVRIRNAATSLKNDPQLRHAQLSLTILNAKTGKEIYSLNPEMGLAPASTQKIFTAIAALDILGDTFRYTTRFSVANLDTALALVVDASGDPTLGSTRWSETGEDTIIANLRRGMTAAKMNPGKIRLVSFRNPGYSSALVPAGWIWQDIGNYYGAGAHGFNWRENQFDVLFKTGTRVGDSISVAAFAPPYLKSFQFDNSELTTGPKGSGDNGYIYVDPWRRNGYKAAGTLPAGEQRFALSASHPEPTQYFVEMLAQNGFSQVHDCIQTKEAGGRLIYTHHSPAMDSIIYWFLQKSINLYGEALLQSIALKQLGYASTEKGVNALVDYWKGRGIDSGSLHVMDGSGLSPQNRVTTNALATALLHAAKQKWYATFYKALPLINGQRMKSGSIEGARAYAGYQHAADGSDYVFAVIVNNYQGSPAAVTRKLWTLLDTLK